MINILINGIGGPTPRSISKSLLHYGRYKKYNLFGTDINKYSRDMYDTSLYKETFLIPPANSHEYWPAIKKIISENNIDFALVQPEIEVLQWAEKAREGSLPCQAMIPEYKLLKTLYDKSVMTNMLKDYNMVPKSIVLDSDLNNLSDIEDSIGYPFWIRSATGSSGLGSLKIQNKQALINWISINSEIEKFMASEFLPGRNLACKLLYFNNKIVRAACGERVKYIMSKIVPSGITGNTSFGRLINDEDVFKVSNEAMDVISKELNVEKHGFFTVDLKEDREGNPKITEINFRHVAFSLCFTMGGINFAEESIRLMDKDEQYDFDFRLHQFEKEFVFLRDVDATPIVIEEQKLLNGNNIE